MSSWIGIQSRHACNEKEKKIIRWKVREQHLERNERENFKQCLLLKLH